MKHIDLNGDWTYNLNLAALSGFQSRNRVYTSIDTEKISNGDIVVEFEDDLSEIPDPYQEQINALEYLINNQDKVIKSVVDKIKNELPEVIINYDLQEDKNYQTINDETIKKLIGFSSIYIHIPSKESVSYIDLVGGCNWDEEHGLNVLLHKNRVVSVGGIDGNSHWKAIKDNGTYEEIKDNHHEKTIPKKYTPHPKYNKLKPSQKSANESFEHNLIIGNHNDKFIELIENNEIDINGKYEFIDSTYLETACGTKNNTLTEYLLKKGAEIRYALHQSIVSRKNLDGFNLILQYGGNINQKGLAGNTVIFELVDQLSTDYHHLAQDVQYNWGKENELRKDIIERQDLIKELILRGADPLIKNDRGNDCFVGYSFLPDNYRYEITDFLKDCINEATKNKHEQEANDQEEKIQDKKYENGSFGRKTTGNNKYT